MADIPSRGYDVRNYIPALKKGAKIPLACLSAGFTTGITSAGIYSSAIANGAITKDKLSATAVHSANISAKAVTSAKIFAAFLSGTIVSGGVTYAKAHGLGAKPKVVIVSAILTAAQRASATILRVTHEEAVSANTSTNVYIRGNQAGNTAIKYQIIAFG
jgi:hypothetical protein